MENAANLTRVYGETEALISCGDMPAHYLEYISSVLSVPLYFVRGNHDTEYAVSQSYEANRPGGDDLHMRILTYRGIVMAGLEGCMRYNREPLQYTESEMFRMVLTLAVKVFLHRLRTRRTLDLMVTHAPPRGIHDLTDRPHWGFKSFNVLITLYRPRYLIHGHVDVLDRRKQTTTVVKHTTVININPVKVMSIERSTPRGL